MFSQSATTLFTNNQAKRQFSFSVKGSASVGVIGLVGNPDDIDKEAARSVLAASFIGEYEQYLKPADICPTATTWREGDHSVRVFYEDYFEKELEAFSQGRLHYWVQATISGKLVGFATFEREKSNPNEIYMNLLVVHPDYQGRSIGGQLVNSLIQLNVIPELSAVHLLLRKKNQGGRVFYSKLGFYSDPDYKRDDNFVELDLLEGLTWKRPCLQHHDEFGGEQRLGSP
jgi:ribosomal protein S18 acetylase RimI-like enzyme